MRTDMKTQKERIARLFLSKCKKRVMNTDLNRISYRYGARIKELREDGWMIFTKREDVGLYSYTLLKIPAKKQLKLLGI